MGVATCGTVGVATCGSVGVATCGSVGVATFGSVGVATCSAVVEAVQVASCTVEMENLLHLGQSLLHAPAQIS